MTDATEEPTPGQRLVRRWREHAAGRPLDGKLRELVDLTERVVGDMDRDLAAFRRYAAERHDAEERLWNDDA